jgi:ABC-type transport system substrate-binding protein
MERRSYWSSIISKRVSRRRALAVCGGVAAGAALLAACGGDGDGEDVSGLITKPQDTSKEARRGSTLLAARNQDVFTFDGQSSLIGGIGAGTIYSRLFKLKPGVLEPTSLEAIGDLADTWEFSPDKLTMTMKLRNTTWHPVPPVSGRKVDPDDIVASWTRWETLGSTRGNYSAKVNPDAPIESMTASDTSTVTVKLSQPVSSLLGLLATANAGMFFLPKEADVTYDPRTTGIGSSQFYVGEFVPSGSLTLKRHEGHYEAPSVYFDGVKEFIIPEYAAAMSQFRSGAIHQYPVRQEDVVQTKRDVPALQIYALDPPTQYGVWRFGWNPALKTPFRDKRLRQALSLSWDRDLWMDTFYNLSSFATEGIELDSYLHSAFQANTGGVFSGLESYWLDPRSKDFGPHAKYFEYNVEEAKKLVAAASPGGVESVLTYPLTPGYGDAFIQQQEVFQDFARAIGINFTPNNPNFNVDFRPKFADSPGDFDGITARFRPAGGIFDPVEVAVYEYIPNAGNGYSGFMADGQQWKGGDPTYTALLRKARQEFDTRARIEQAHEFQRLEAEHQYQMSFPGTASGLTLLWPAVRNYNVFKKENDQSSQRTNLWLDTTKPPFTGA